MTAPSADDLSREAAERPDALALHRARAESSKLRQQNRELLERLHTAEARADLLAALEDASPPKPIERRERKSRVPEATAFLLASDWHVGEEVRPALVNGRNEFNTAIARRRVEKFAEGANWLVEMHRSKFKIRDVVLCLIGDMVTGWLHQDQQTTNTALPMEEVLLVFELCRETIDRLLLGASPDRLHVTGNYGNHARLTMRTLHSAQAETSLEFLVYSFLARHYANDKRVTFNLCAGKLLPIPVYEYVVRASHGDDVNYGGGIGGVTIPINKAIRSWNTLWHADVDVMGHWHQYVSLPNLVINSSLIGYSPYSIKIKAPYEAPTQSFFLMEPGRGKRADNRIWLEPHAG